MRASYLIAPRFLAVIAALSFAQAPGTSFPLYDNMFYKGKPDTTKFGLIPSNILYENKIWPNPHDVGTLPDHNAFQVLVRAAIANPGPLVLDIESVSLKTSPDTARRNAATLAKLADWAHEAAPGKIISYYGTNTLPDVPQSNFAAARELTRHVDAFSPSLYTFDDDRSKWKKRAETARAQSRELDPHKPVYFYLWPQYHEGTPKALSYIDAGHWKFQLESARRSADGIVIWSPSKYPWDDRSGWWRATQQFAASLQPPPKNSRP